jgi:hypothetical protein
MLQPRTWHLNMLQVHNFIKSGPVETFPPFFEWDSKHMSMLPNALSYYFLTDAVNSFHALPHLETIFITNISVFYDVTSCSLRVCCSEPLVEEIETTCCYNLQDYNMSHPSRQLPLQSHQINFNFIHSNHRMQWNLMFWLKVHCTAASVPLYNNYNHVDLINNIKWHNI